MERVAVLGSPGAGKTRFSLALAEITGLPVIHLDQAYWRPGWTEPATVDWRRTVTEIVSAPRWITDGNYGGTMDIRLPRADTVVVLDLPVPLCLWRAIRRVAEAHGQVRPDMAPGCPERLDLGFLQYIVRFGRDGGGRTRMLERLDELPAATDVHVLRLPREMRDFLRRV